MNGREAPFVLLAGADVERLARFRAAYPEAVIDEGWAGTWQAIIPAPDGETVAVRYTLRELLDKLDTLLEDPR